MLSETDQKIIDELQTSSAKGSALLLLTTIGGWTGYSPAPGRRGDQRRLPDAGFAIDQDHAAGAGSQLGDGISQHRHLGLASDQGCRRVEGHRRVPLLHRDLGDP